MYVFHTNKYSDNADLLVSNATHLSWLLLSMSSLVLWEFHIFNYSCVGRKTNKFALQTMTLFHSSMISSIISIHHIAYHFHPPFFIHHIAIAPEISSNASYCFNVPLHILCFVIRFFYIIHSSKLDTIFFSLIELVQLLDHSVNSSNSHMEWITNTTHYGRMN